MEVYMVYKFSKDSCDVVYAFTTLEKANDIAIRCMYDSWRVQDWIIPLEITRDDGTTYYSILNGNQGYFTEIQKVEE